MKISSQSITIETLLLVAVWHQPAVFQGCFKIDSTNLYQSSVFLFFRCDYENIDNKDYVDDDFSQNDYNFSHLYNDFYLISLEPRTETINDALYILYYALHKTLLKMRTNQKQTLAFFDKEAINAMVKKVTPFLRQEGVWEASEAHIGFAVAIDFNPQEPIGELAVKTLFDFGSHNKSRS